MTRNPYAMGAALAVLALAAACTPTVKVQAPDKPIEINLNIRVQQEVRIKIDRELDQVFKENPDLFGLPPESIPSASDKPQGTESKGK